jgi:hypothetical protein
MTEAHKQMVEDVKRYLYASDLSDECKDGLTSLITSAANLANGHPDKIQGISELLLAMVLQDVRNSIRQPKKIATEVAAQMTAHVAQCPIAGGKGLPARWAWLYPFRWPIAALASVLACSPHAPAILHLISQLSER